MNKSFLKNNKISILIVFVVYLFFFVTGLIVYKDFGLSSDEWILRYEGFKNLKYIYQILSPSLLISVTEINEIINQLDVLSLLGSCSIQASSVIKMLTIVKKQFINGNKFLAV